MSKAKSDQQAKAKAALEAKRKAATADQTGGKVRPGQFDPGPGSIKGPTARAGAKHVGGARKGAARSR